MSAPNNFKDQTQFGVSVINTFPQPTRPVNSYYLEPEQTQLPQTSYPVGADINMGMEFQACRPEERFPEQVPGDYYCAEEKTTETGAAKKEKFEELVKAAVESYEKLPENIRNQITLDKYKTKPSLVSKGLKVDSGSSRGIGGSAIGDSAEKLERFKIKTIKLGGVVNEEDESSSS